MKQPKNDVFDNAWKVAFEKASIAPPDIIWKNIENALPTETLVEKPSANGMATSSKLIIGAGVILISGLSYFYINDSSSDNYTSKTNETNNGKNITKPNEPANMDSKIENKNLAFNTPILAKKQFISEIKKDLPTQPENQIVILEEDTKILEPITFTKIEEKVYQMQPKGLKLPKIIMETPDLISNTDTQIVNTYFDPNAIPAQQNNKGKFWHNFKISGGIRVSN